jgi:hypothetical protein
VTDFQELRSLIEERAGFQQLLVLAGPSRALVLDTLHSLGTGWLAWQPSVVDVGGDFARDQARHGPGLLAGVENAGHGGRDVVVMVEDLLDPAMTSLLSHSWPLTLVVTRADLFAPVEVVVDWLQGHRIEVLRRDGGHLERQRTNVRALTLKDLGGGRAVSGEHFFDGPWEEFRARPLSSWSDAGVEVLDPRWGSLSHAALEVAGRLRADGGAMSLSTALEAAQALEE